MTTKIPPGHKVITYPPSPLPHVTRCSGGFVLADIGVKGIDQLEDVEHVFQEVQNCLKTTQTKKISQKNGARILLASSGGSLSDLFAPNNPKVNSWTNGGVIWTVMDDGLDPFLGDSPGLERLVKLFQGIPEQCLQCVFLSDHVHNEGALVKVLQSLGIESRRLPTGGSILAEVHRPEGIILSALLSTPITHSLPNNENEVLSLIEQIKNIQLKPIPSPFVSSCRTFGKAAVRNGRRRRLLLQVAEASTEEETNAAWQNLLTDLLKNEYPLLVPTSADGRAMPMDWPGIGKAMPIFSDVTSLELMAQQTHQTGSFAHAEFSTKQLAAWLLQINVPPVFNVYRGPSEPLYVQLGLTSLGPLSEGRIPNEILH
mmetsp:Transcript_11867/g.20623  ORF Transcript_11867/g.20623 Transcript_11867/m.20623 type:complete len:371 (-) Transcript_11867:137-1249(-)